MPGRGIANFVEFVFFIINDKPCLSLNITEFFGHCFADDYYL